MSSVPSVRSLSSSRASVPVDGSSARVPGSRHLFRGELPDLAPHILRQRLVIEGCCPDPISREQLHRYLSELAVVCDMVALTDPVTHRSDRFGWAGWMHWETSGVHVYAWDEPQPFFSVDIYTCKRFDSDEAAEFTRRFFDAAPLVARDFSSR